MSLSRHKDGAVEVRILRSSGDDGEEVGSGAIEFATDRYVELRIERSGPPEQPTVDVYLDGVPLVLGAPFAELGRAAQPIRVGVYAEGETGRPVDLLVDDVRVVYREAR